MEQIVYYDEDYPTAFVQREISNKIVSFLKSKGFMEYNAENLGKWMEKSIDEGKCHQSIVVFGQDVVPETICHDKCPASLLRTYLDCGGTAVWIGEIPCYYQGLNPSNASKLKIDYDGGKTNLQGKIWRDEEGKYGKGWSRHGCFGVLGVLSVYFDFQTSKVAITKEGEFFGLRNPWYGHKPITVKGLNILKNKPITLARSKPSYLMPMDKAIFLMEREKKVPFSNFLEYVSKLTGLIPSMIVALTALVSLLAGSAWIVTLALISTAIFLMLVYVLYWLFFLKTKYANAWFKNFNSRYPESGFIRIWDFVPHRITAEMLEDLHRVILTRTERKKPRRI